VGDLAVDRLRARPNVVMHPQVAITEVPGVIRGFDVGLLPYADQPMTRYTYPAKLHQYLAGGLRIASTPLPDLDELGDLVEQGAGTDGFVAAVGRALAAPRREAARRAVAARNTWEGRVDALAGVVRSHLDGRPLPGGPDVPSGAPQEPAAGRPRLSVVVISWNERDDLRRCLDAVAREPDPGGREVVVVDNASDDGTDLMLAGNHPHARVHRNRRNRGVTVARNQGIRLARGRYVAMLDSDTEPRPGALTTLCDFLDANPAVGMVGPRLVYEDGSLQHSCRRVPSPTAVIANRLTRIPAMRELPARRRYLMIDEGHDAPMDVEYLLGAAMVFRREVVEAIGLFDERFGFSTPGGYGFDDADWGVRVRRAGWRVVYLPEAEMVHGYRRRLASQPISRQSVGLALSYAVLRAKHRGALRTAPPGPHGTG
jgi:GT2 family glycosyltransferase